MNTIILSIMGAVPVLILARLGYEKARNLHLCTPKKKAKVLFYACDFEGINFSVWECDETR